ncbi:hypothetical protein F7725_025806 [Dissostichus mawsoni]|uniref:non-specific serine/threonine protein kinase n=1 Tax=Dissostichus mawsoni TaxID=36200 RepID=A0A7J5X596_DISMA|nr:hypothetical protein F7725_025806 [Dissostichus mawsoni]
MASSSGSFSPPKLSDFILTERLGSGTYATVYKAYRKKSLNRVSTENLLTEIEILKTMRHPHIVQLKDFQWDAENIYLILEWCSGGDLSCFIRSRRILPETVVRRFLQQIDFGFAQYMSPWDEQSSLRGSPLYMAPEMVCRRQYDHRVDLWSALFGRAPFASRSYAELEEKIRSNQPIELPPGARVSKNCRDLLLRLLDRNPDARITFKEFFTHPFYVSRAEELKSLLASDNRLSFEEARNSRDILRVINTILTHGDFLHIGD